MAEFAGQPPNREAAGEFKKEGNDAFLKGDFEAAVNSYTSAIKLLERPKSTEAATLESLEDSDSESEDSELLKDRSILLANRSAAYLGLKRYIPAYHDALNAAKADPGNWKAHWRQGTALMSMTMKRFRTQQAISAFEACLQCESLPENKRTEVMREIQKAQHRLEEQEANVRVPAPMHLSILFDALFVASMCARRLCRT